MAQELSARGAKVYAGARNPDRVDVMAHGVDGHKSDPAQVAALALDAVAAGQHEVLADELSNRVLTGLAAGVAALYPAPKRT